MEMNFLLILSLILFSIGIFCVLCRRNLLIILMGIELMLNSVSLNLIVFSKLNNDVHGMFFAIMIFVTAAVEVAVAVALIYNIHKEQNTLSLDKLNLMKR